MYIWSDLPLFSLAHQALLVTMNPSSAEQELPFLETFSPDAVSFPNGGRPIAFLHTEWEVQFIQITWFIWFDQLIISRHI